MESRIRIGKKLERRLGTGDIGRPDANTFAPGSNTTPYCITERAVALIGCLRGTWFHRDRQTCAFTERIVALIRPLVALRGD